MRTLEREIAKLAARRCAQILERQGREASSSRPTISATSPACASFRHGMSEEEDQIGAVTGLAWTEVGGELLTIESVTVPGKGEIKTTGKLGDVMTGVRPGGLQLREGARAELRHQADDLRSARTSTSTCPKARCPRTGRRAGIGMVTSIISTLTGIPVRPRRGDDRRGHAARPRAADRRAQGEAARGACAAASRRC